VIDRPALVAWRSKAPWPNPVQIEQDLLLSRLMIEIARDEVLGPELVMRGGTCLHKLHLPTPLRYSEDLDYVRCTRGGIKPYTQALAKIAEDVGLTVSSRQRSGQMVHVYFDGQPTEGIGRIRIKIEMNIAETEPHRPRRRLVTIGLHFLQGASSTAGSARIEHELAGGIGPNRARVGIVHDLATSGSVRARYECSVRRRSRTPAQTRGRDVPDAGHGGSGRGSWRSRAQGMDALRPLPWRSVSLDEVE
jgi:hypothetical protein